MSRSTPAILALPPQATKALAAFGEHLRIARQRRGESLRSWSSRCGISVPTLQRLEAGDPSVGMGAYATVLWLVGKAQTLSQIAQPQSDEEALTREIERTTRRRRR